MTEEFEKGDKVKWKSPQGDVIGEVKKKIASPMEIKGHYVSASKDNPQYLVKSNKTGKEAAHKPESLKKVKE
ncbi:MAG: DUF2945 domain-containing protein [Acaryochloridaceae cyanobacterium RU_4_10]|nr:DUF2945 domain-containing protein [Acaryochloridaceae cyanobacterium RU_4_10]